MAIVNIFDWYDLFVNQVAGDVNIFIFGVFILIAVAGAMFKLPNIVTLTLIGVAAMILSAFFQTLLPIVLLIVGMFFAWGLSRLVTRG